jgi:SAM-dependent methyltransferase
VDPASYRNAVDPASYRNANDLSADVHIEEWMAFRGHLFARIAVPSRIADSEVCAIAFIFNDTALEQPLDPSRFPTNKEWVTPIPASQATPDVALGLRCVNGSRWILRDPAVRVLDQHNWHKPAAMFSSNLAALSAGRVAELGARARSGVTYRHLVPDHLDYLGIDIEPGPNVDLVGDIHLLSVFIERNSLDGVLSIATFEHLAMPWKAAVEINRVLKPGGLCYIASHQSFPLHEEPWDFWRFSDSAWQALFNEATGFEILDVAMGESAAITGRALTGITWQMDEARAYLGTSVVARKISEASVDWPVNPSIVVKGRYPA